LSFIFIFFNSIPVPLLSLFRSQSTPILRPAFSYALPPHNRRLLILTFFFF
jgi:hypothetical protein